MTNLFECFTGLGISSRLSETTKATPQPQPGYTSKSMRINSALIQSTSPCTHEVFHIDSRYIHGVMCLICSRIVRNEVEEESHLRREMEEDLAELREDYEQTNGQRMANYEAELAEWKTYEKARVNLHDIVCLGTMISYHTMQVHHAKEYAEYDYE